MEEPADLSDPETWLELASKKLNNARRIMDIGLYGDSISRAYYAMFYAAKGALLTEGVDLRKHSSTVAKFRELFVITGRVDASYLKHLGRAQSARESSDYAPILTFSREDALEILTEAEAFIDKMGELVKRA